MVAIISNRTGIPFGMITPREALDEWIKQQRKIDGQSFLVKRLKGIKRHLAKCHVSGCPVPILDMALKSHEFDAVIQEAWSVVKAEPDGIQAMIRDMAVQGRA